MSDLELDIRWNDKGEWVPFPVEDILHMPVRHACHLFSNKHQVIAKQSGAYVVNSAELQQKYRVQRKRCTTFADILSKGGDQLDIPLGKVGLL